MRLKKCISCGKLYWTSRVSQAKCDACLAAQKSTTIRRRVCRECGQSFDGGPRAWYCPECRAIRAKICAAKYRANGPVRALGSTDYCAICGKEYVVAGGLQKYCPDCAPEAIRAADREASKKWNVDNDYCNKRTHADRYGIKVCVICGREIPRSSSRVTCSQECSRQKSKIDQAEADLQRGQRKSPPSEKK